MLRPKDSQPLSILRKAALTVTALGFLLVPGEAHSGTTTQNRSSCRPGDQILVDEPLFSGSENSSLQIATDGTRQLNTILGDVQDKDGHDRVFVVRSPDLRSKDTLQAGFLDVSSQLNAACSNYQQNELANRGPRALQPTNDVWLNRVVRVQEQTTDGKSINVVSKVDVVVDDDYVTVDSVVNGKVVTKKVSRNSLLMEKLPSYPDDPYIPFGISK